MLKSRKIFRGETLMENEVTSVNVSYTTPLGKKASRAFTNVDPNASDKEIVDFSEAMNDLTTNTLTSTSKITKKEIDTSITYYDLEVTITKGNDTNNGITINGTSGATIEINKMSTTTDAYQMSRVGIAVKANNTVIVHPSYTIEPNGYALEGATVFMEPTSGGIQFNVTNAQEEGATGTVTIKFLPGIQDNIHYNGTTVTISIV